LTAEEVKNENDAPAESLLDRNKEVFFINQVILTKAGNTEVLVISAVCTHLGCVPIPYLGAFNGWVCICHGSVYDKVFFNNYTFFKKMINLFSLEGLGKDQRLKIYPILTILSMMEYFASSK